MEKTILYEQIYMDILDKIKLGVFGPGERLPSEKELAEQYGVSRITSKRAMDMLAENKYITRSRGRGSFVDENAIDSLEQGNIPKTERTKEDPLIAVIFDTFRSDFGCELLRGIELGCRKKGYDMLFKCSYGNVEEENKAIRSAQRLGVKGLILMSAQGEVYNNIVLQISLKKFPLVLVDRQMKGISIPCVKIDNYAASRELIQILIARGHKKICFVTHSFDNTSSIFERHNGFADCVLEHEGVSGSVEQVECYNPMSENMAKEYINFDFSEITEIIRRHEDHTAFLVVEFQLGVLFRKALMEMNLDKEIAVFDFIPGMYDDRYGFIYVKQDENSMGMQAVQMLDHIIRKENVCETLNIPYEIVLPGNGKTGMDDPAADRTVE